MIRATNGLGLERRNEDNGSSEPHDQEISRMQALVPVSAKALVSYALAAVIALFLVPSSHGVTTFQLSNGSEFIAIPNFSVPSQITGVVAVIILALATVWAYIERHTYHRTPAPWLHIIVGVVFILAFLTWAGSGRDVVIPLVTLLSGALALSVPLIFGSLAGTVGERSGTINIAIEGQLLFGAFFGALVASMCHNAWIGVVAAPVAGMLVSVLLVFFGIKYRVNQIIVGVVLNVLVLGLTNFFYSTVLNVSRTSRDALNVGLSLPVISIPVLSQIPIVGPVLFSQTILVYLMYVIVIVLQIMMFRSRWGLRMRACGEHPQAADTVGINVVRTRIHNAIMGGALAGLGGAYFTLGSGLGFSKEMTAGMGFIALAAMILGGWTPVGAVGAALLFGFAMNLGFTFQIIGSPMPSQFVLMIPYVVTILAIAGFVGKVRAPAAEGIPYP